MVYKLLINTVTVSSTGHTSTNQSIVEFDNYSAANEAYSSIKLSPPVVVEPSSTNYAKSTTTAIKLYQ